MQENNTQNCSIDLDSWLQQPSGRYIHAWEQSVLDKLTADIFGYNAVQIGLPQFDFLSASRMPNKWITNNLAYPGIDHPLAMLHDFAELPFESHSLDLVVLPHVLEFASEPHQILREVERVLIPEGRLIICGLNNTSLWGARQYMGRCIGHYFLPRNGEFISQLRLKDWLKLLNMEVGRPMFGCYAPPLSNQKWLQRFQLMETAGDRWWPYLGAAYVMQAIKRTKGMHLIGPAIVKKVIKVPTVVPVANRQHPTK